MGYFISNIHQASVACYSLPQTVILTHSSVFKSRGNKHLEIL